jgi:hypothetical protein
LTKVSPHSQSIAAIEMCFILQNQLVLVNEPAIVRHPFDLPAVCRPFREIKKTNRQEGQAEE